MVEHIENIQDEFSGFSAFAKACQQNGDAVEQNSAPQAARCFVTLFETVREKQKPAQ